MGTDSSWDIVGRLAARFDAHGTVPEEQRVLLQILKIQEEVGEVAQAVIGATGQSPRKGFSHTWADVEAEVCDTIVTCMVALERMRPGTGRETFDRYLGKIADRDLGPAEEAGAGPEAAALITNGRGEYLLHLREAAGPARRPGYWSLVGGPGRDGEAAADTAARLLAAGTGLTVPLTEFGAFGGGGGGGGDGSVSVHVGLWDGDPRTLPVAPGVALHFFPPATVARLRTVPWCGDAVRAHAAVGR